MNRYELKFIPETIILFETQITYRVAPNYTCEIIDIESKIKSQGNGTKALLNFEDYIKNKFGIKNLYAFTRYTNHNAHRWYNKNGFIATIIPNFYFDETENLGVIMTKKI